MKSKGGNSEMQKHTKMQDTCPGVFCNQERYLGEAERITKQRQAVLLNKVLLKLLSGKKVIVMHSDLLKTIGLALFSLQKVTQD